MFKPILIVPLCAALFACGTPQQLCIARETRDLQVVDRLIAEAEGNLNRGYAFKDVVISRTIWVNCQTWPVPVDGKPVPAYANPRLCLEDRDETITKPVAIDLASERSKLLGLKAKRKQLALAGERSIAACRKAYPE